MRQVVLDTETTGIGEGHRIIEIGCVELLDRQLTGKHFHVYLNPQRAVDEGAFRVHGISDDFLQDKPLFKDIATDFLTFVTGSELIIHNAAFDVGFLNTEMTLANKSLKTKISTKITELCTVCDTLLIAREKHPGQRVNLDALCKRYDIDNSNRELHGALLDAEILAKVYLAMTGGQGRLFDDNPNTAQQSAAENTQSAIALVSHSPIVIANEEENILHQEFLDLLVKRSGINRWIEN